MSELPCAQQIWSHGTNSLSKLSVAVEDSSVTAIEVDIVMGRDLMAPEDHPDVPVMSHPPYLESSLSAATFLDLVTRGDAMCDHVQGVRRLTKHIKLDFKHQEAVEPTLQALLKRVTDGNGKTIFLNADILAGPGKSPIDVTVPADEFVQTCLALMSDQNGRNMQFNFAFSLGFKVEVHDPFGHTDDHLGEMAAVVKRHNLTSVVLAINARLLYKNVAPFESFLLDFPSTQILVWTGSTEPPISRHKVDYIKNRFTRGGHHDRVGFDCNVAQPLLLGLVWDLAVDLYGLFFILSKFLGLRPPSQVKYKSG